MLHSQKYQKTRSFLIFVFIKSFPNVCKGSHYFLNNQTNSGKIGKKSRYGRETFAGFIMKGGVVPPGNVPTADFQ